MLISAKRFLHSEAFATTARTLLSAFTRERRLTLPTLVAFLLNQVRGGLQSELDLFFEQVLGCEDPRQVTKGAFSQARRKLRPEALRGLLQYLARATRKHVPVPRWHGLRVLAIDGSTLRLPELGDVRETFGGMLTSCGKFRVMARLVSLFDVATQMPFDTKLVPYATDERSIATELWESLSRDDLVLLDRGFPSYSIFTELQDRAIPFCARIDSTRWSEVQKFLRRRSRDALVEMTPSRSIKTRLKAAGITPRTLRLRLLRHRLPNGTQLVLVTSLLDQTIPPESFAALYHWRWSIEEGFKHLKSRTEVENWTGKSACTVYQDFYAKNLIAAITALLAFQSKPWAPQLSQFDQADEDGLRQRPNLTYALSRLKHALARMLLGVVRIGTGVRKITGLLAKTRERTRANRSYPRLKGVRLHGFHQAYKRCP